MSNVKPPTFSSSSGSGMAAQQPAVGDGFTYVSHVALLPLLAEPISSSDSKTTILYKFCHFNRSYMFSLGILLAWWLRGSLTFVGHDLPGKEWLWDRWYYFTIPAGIVYGCAFLIALLCRGAEVGRVGVARTVVYYTIQTIMFVTCWYMVNRFNIGIAGGCLIAVVWAAQSMKAHSYYAFHAHEYRNPEHIHPNLFTSTPQAMCFFRFTFVPALVYTPTIPYLPHIPALALFNELVTACAGLFLVHELHLTHIFPYLQWGCTDFFEAAELIVFCDATFRLFVYTFWHSICSVFAFATQYGDRRGLYGEWWISTSITSFSRNWSVPVHNWLLQHTVKDGVALVQRDVEKRVSKTKWYFILFVSFCVSSLIHELCMILIIHVPAFPLMTAWLFLLAFISILLENILHIQLPALFISVAFFLGHTWMYWALSKVYFLPVVLQA